MSFAGLAMVVLILGVLAIVGLVVFLLSRRQD